MPGGGTEPQGEVCFHGPRKLGVGSADAQITPGPGSESTISRSRERELVAVLGSQPFSHRV